MASFSIKYPYSCTSSAPEELKALFGHDHTFIEFKDNYRRIDNFTKTNIAAFDNDDHSDNPNDWVGIPDIPKLFPGVPCIISTSRHHMKQKGDKGPRPRYHVMLLTDTITSPEEYTALLTKVQKHFPFFDKKALDSARFYFGNPDMESHQQHNRCFAHSGYRIRRRLFCR